ncbi:MAG TPA: hypothetical protein VKN35_11800 [Xanthomonadales bacterium]|nr:hypothetical protein [Xanthomonadales bacterium]
MTNNRRKITLATALCAGLISAAAQAAGPLYLYADQTPLHWDVSNPISVYTDMGELCDTNPDWPYSGCLSNEQADAAVAYGFAQWTAVPSSSFQAEVAGDFASIGLGDINGSNAEEVIGAYNGGGYHVMYDTDASILQDFFGAGSSVLGISSPEWAEGDVITESWAVINVASVPEGDDGTKAAGVMTHEFGHGINLAHTQANGHITFYGAPWYWIPWSVMGCTDAPYDVSPIEDWTEYQQWVLDVAIPNTETMYPFIDVNETSIAQSTVEQQDDITSLSNIYPGAGWPQDFGTISGEIRLKDGTTGLTGINVVVRSVADPLGDVVTALSGDLSQGEFGPDGRFTINGLTPGAEYIVYVESIVAGGFSTPPASLPTFPEYWNGANESNDATRDNPCEWDTIVAAAGSSKDASIDFNGIAGAPDMVLIPVDSATDVDNSGQVLVGNYGGQVGWFYNSRTGEFELFDSIQSPKLANDNKTVVAVHNAEVPPWEGGMYEPGLWSTHKGWQPFDLPADEEGCDGWIFSPYDISGRADKVVGLGYVNGCPSVQYNDDWTEIESINKHWAAVWDAKQGMQTLETPDWVLPELENCQWDTPTGCQVRGSRANAISNDGNLVVGHMSVMSGYWMGAAWQNGNLIMMGEDDPKGWVGSANAVNKDGSAVVGGLAGSNEYLWGEDAYIWSPNGGTRNLGHMVFSCEIVAPWDCEWQPEFIFPAEGWAVSDKGDIVLGRAGDWWNGFVGFIWTEATGMLELNEFLQNQGVMEAFNNQLIGPLAVSGDGKTMAGWGTGPNGYVSFAVTLDQVWMCNKGTSKLAGFPGAMATQLSKGASLGLCEADRPIAP